MWLHLDQSQPEAKAEVGQVLQSTRLNAGLLLDRMTSDIVEELRTPFASPSNKAMQTDGGLAAAADRQDVRLREKR